MAYAGHTLCGAIIAQNFFLLQNQDIFHYSLENDQGHAIFTLYFNQLKYYLALDFNHEKNY